MEGATTEARAVVLMEVEWAVMVVVVGGQTAGTTVDGEVTTVAAV